MTYSIVARDPVSGQLGVAVQSHWFSVGSVVSWARAAVGAVATQSIAEPAYGPRLLERLEAGEAPDHALQSLVGEDSEAHYRQVAVVDASGAVAAHTGGSCIPYAGDRQGEGFSVQANMMATPDVWPAMASAFEEAGGSLARRLLTALDAGEAAGGDVRGRQSAALLVVAADTEPWESLVELRVEDDPEPLAELARLLTLREAYDLAEEADELLGQGRQAEAADRYRQAAELAPESAELAFWAGLSLVQGGETDAGIAKVREAIASHEGWRDLLARLDPELAPAAEPVRRILGIDRTP